MSFIHPDASLMDTKRSSHPMELGADRVNVEDEKRFSPESIETRASSSPRDQVQIKIVMLKVQVIFAWSSNFV